MTTPLTAPVNSLSLNLADPSPAEFRVGRIVSFAPNQAVIDVGGSQFSAAYLRGTTLLAGDIVYISRQGGGWVIHGALLGVGTDLLQNGNGSFEAGPPGDFPFLWNLANTTGTSDAYVREIEGAPDGVQMASVGTLGGGATAYLYSVPIAVMSGAQYSVSAVASGDYQPSDTATADIALVGLWFANTTNLYPTTSSADTVITSINDIPPFPAMTTITGTVTAPVNGYMRVALRTATVGTQQVLWDQVIVRSV